MSKPSIAISPNMSDYFRDVVAGAVRSRQIDATEGALTYVVGLLCEYAHPDENAESTLCQPLTFLLRDAMEAQGPERFKRLRALGDGVLYAAGFFGDHVLKGTDRGYVLSVGSSAYDQASAMLRVGVGSRADSSNQGPGVLSELASKFERFVEVLADVADGTIASSAHDERSVVRLYERWMKTGSARLAEELGALGIVPTRGSGGVH
jgi:hypothetical protein